MSRPKLLLLGAGGHARSCIEVIEQQGLYEIAGLVGLPNELDTQLLGYKVIGTDADLGSLSQISPNALVTAGQILTPALRIHLFDMATALGFKFPVIKSPTAHISSHAVVGPGTILMHGVIVNAGAAVGKNCILNTRAIVEHDVTIEHHCHISTGAILNGQVFVGSGTFFGSGSVARECIKIEERCVVGMGLSVRRNLKKGTQYSGRIRQ